MKTLLDPSPLYYNGDLISTYLALPELRLFVPFSSIGESGNAVDFSGQGRTLTNNGSAPRGIYNNLVPYADLNGSSQYFSRADEAGLDITGALTFGGWFWFDVLSASSYYFMMAKWGTAVGSYSYLLMNGSGSTNITRGLISSNGTALSEVNTGTVTPVINTWNLITLTYVPSTSLTLRINNVSYANTTSIPANIYNSTSQLEIGRQPGGSNYLDGRAAGVFLCAAALPDDGHTWLYERTRKFFV